MITTIESLPMELLLIIFSYFSINDLFNIFHELNSHFRSIIYSLSRVYFTLEEDWDHEQVIIPFYSIYVTELVVRNDQFTDFSYFPNIRSIKLSLPTLAQCNAIQSHVFPHVENLSICNLNSDNHTEELSRTIFSSSFPSLRSCQLTRIKFAPTHSPCNLIMKDFSISPCTWNSNLFAQLSNLFPHLLVLRLTNIFNMSFDFISRDTPVHIGIRRLSLQFQTIDQTLCDHTDNILSIVPNLEKFVIVIDFISHIHPFPFQLLSDVMYRREPQLCHFPTEIVCHSESLPYLPAIRANYPLNTSIHPK